jgi:transcriptional regulator with XRE-family HTH domain
MSWTSSKLSDLRRRLGWTRAELSRRVGVQVTEIQAWEQGDSQPGHEVSIEFTSLESHLERYSESIAADPIAESFLQKNRLNQIFKNDLKS